MKTHWKNYQNPDYIGAYSFQPKERKIVTINTTERKVIKGPNNREDECLVVYFIEDIKPMICNATNSKAISKVVGSPYVEDWPSTKIELYVDSNVKAFGDTVEAVRVKSTAPVIKKPTITEAQKRSAAEKDASRELVEKHYSITDEDWDEIESYKTEPSNEG